MINKNQKGIGLISLVIGIVVLGLFGVYGAQIGLAYLDKGIIEKAAKNVLLEHKNNDNANVSTIRKALLTKISTNQIELDGDDITVVKEGSGFNIVISYDKIIGVNDDISIKMNFEIDETTP